MRTGGNPLQGKDNSFKKEIKKFNTGTRRGKLNIVGIGPGFISQMTERAISAIKESDVIVGYIKYVDLIFELVKGKEVITTAMMGEVKRCDMALDEVLKGKCVSVVSSGDAGIYGMAGLIFELAKKRNINKSEIFKKIDFEVIPGISCVNAAASILGAPLMLDFAVISLSDLLVPWPEIENRLNAAASSDFVIVLTNPKSKKRVDNIVVAHKIFSQHRGSGTLVGIVKDAKRENESSLITTLDKMLDCHIDMTTTIIVGNSQTVKISDFMVTRRGYGV